MKALAAIDHTNRYTVYVNSETDQSLRSEAPSFRFVRCRVRASFRPARILYEQFVLPVVLWRHGIDVLLNPGFTMPALSPCPSVTVFHDLQHKRHPEFFRNVDRPFWNLLLWLAAIRSRSLLAVSPATAVDLARYMRVSGDRVRIVPHGVDPEFFRLGRRQSSQKFFLTVSTLHPHKNLERLLEAFHLFRENHPDYSLVITGVKGFASARLVERCDALGLNDCVKFTGWIDRNDLYALYEQADACIFPSLFEGFGMPVLEALAAGIPTACSAIAPLDWVGGSAVMRLDPYSVTSILEALARISGDCDFRERAKTAGPEQARRFDWNLSAKATLEELVKRAGS